MIYSPNAGWFADLALTWAFASLVLLALAYRAARRHRYRTHMRIMTATSVAGLSFVLATAGRRLLPGFVAPVIPRAYLPVLAFHIALAIVTLGMSALLIRAQTAPPELIERRPKLLIWRQRHRVLGPLVWAGWLITFLGGIANYYVLYGLPD
ncbi:MAG TPA: DUF420 domain-containing protein [Acidobacteriota bacterium]